MPTLATLIKILSTSLWAYFKSFGCFIEKNRKQVFSGHCLGSTQIITANTYFECFDAIFFVRKTVSQQWFVPDILGCS